MTCTARQDESLGVCLFDASWHQGVIGLVAGRIKDRLHRPVIAFARAEDGSLRGSARSVAGVNIRDALDSIATRHAGLIDKFGGHAMAAGLSLSEANLPDFRSAFAAEIGARADRESLDRGDLLGRRAQRRGAVPRIRPGCCAARGPGVRDFRSRHSTANFASSTAELSAANT